jgi:hypothetical protein
MKKEKVFFDELLWESYVKSNPKEFLKEELKHLTKQKRVHTGRMDLTFRDMNNNIVIVELQRFALDRAHFYRTLDYKADLELDGEKNIRMICLCNEVELKRENYAKQWNLEIITISEDKVKEIIKKINPNIEFVNSKEDLYNDNINHFEVKRKIHAENFLELKKIRKEEPELEREILEEVLIKYRRQNRIFPACRYSSLSIFEHNINRYFNNYRSGFYWERESESYLKQFKKFREENHYRGYLHDINNYNFSNLVKKDEKGQITGFHKPKIDLIFLTDQYFGRNDLKIYWLPHNWNSKEANDFIFGENYYQYIEYNKQRHEIFNFRDVLLNGVVCQRTIDGYEDRPYRDHSYLINISGYIAANLFNSIEILIKLLNENFEVKTENPIKLVKEKFTEEDWLLEFGRSQYDSENKDKIEKIIGFKINQRTHIG